MRSLGLLLGLLVGFYGIKTNNGNITTIGGIVFIFFGILFWIYATTGHVEKNDYDNTWIKPEHSAEPQKLPKGKKASNIDGVATEKGMFKVPNATGVKIDAEGNIKFTTGSKIANNIFKLNGGYKDADFARDNQNWQLLWQKYNEIES